MDRKEYLYGRRVTMLGIVGNIVVSIGELLLGIVGRSSALIADAVHSFSDVGATSAVYIGLKYSSKPRDENHPYGHGKIDSIVALFLGSVLAVTAVYLAIENIAKIHNREHFRPELYTLVAALGTVVIKEWMYRFTLRAGKRLRSPSITANAYHHRSDAFTSIGVFFGILGAYYGYPILDPVAALIVALIIFKMAFDIFRDAILDLTDIGIPGELRTEIENIVEKWNPEYYVMETIGRRMGTRYQVNLKIRIDPYTSAKDGVSDFRHLEKKIRQKLPSVQGVDIKGDVDSHKADERESEFKVYVGEVLNKYAERYRKVESLEFHFMPNQFEAHCNMVVDPTITVGAAHDITHLIEEDVYSKFETAQIIIHIEPDDR